MAFLSSGNSHHDVALVETGEAGTAPGALHHFALKVGNSIADLGWPCEPALQPRAFPFTWRSITGLSQGLYVSDPTAPSSNCTWMLPSRFGAVNPSLVANSTRSRSDLPACPRGAMDFRLLGPLEVCDAEDSQLDVGRPMQRALLALLLLDPGRVVSVATIVDGLWVKAHLLRSRI